MTEYFIWYQAKFGSRIGVQKIAVNEEIIRDNKYRSYLDKTAWEAFKKVFKSESFIIRKIWLEQRTGSMSVTQNLHIYGQKGIVV